MLFLRLVNHIQCALGSSHEALLRSEQALSGAPLVHQPHSHTKHHQQHDHYHSDHSSTIPTATSRGSLTAVTLVAAETMAREPTASFLPRCMDGITNKRHHQAKTNNKQKQKTNRNKQNQQQTHIRMSARAQELTSHVECHAP